MTFTPRLLHRRLRKQGYVSSLEWHREDVLTSSCHQEIIDTDLCVHLHDYSLSKHVRRSFVK